MKAASSGLNAQFGRTLRGLLHWLFDGIFFPAALREKLTALSDRGTVVIITRGHSSWLALAFCHLMAKDTAIAFVGGVDFFWHRPLRRVGQLIKRLAGYPEPFERPTIAGLPPGRRAAQLARTILANRPAFIMLPVPQSHRRLFVDWTDYLQVLAAVQAHTARPIFLVPHVLVAREQSGKREGGLIDRFFGGSRRPGFLRGWTLLRILRHGVMRQGDPIDLSVEPIEGTRLPKVASRHLRAELHRRIDEEERVVAGPRLTGFDQMRSQVLSDQDVRAAIVEQAAARGLSEPLLEIATEAMLRKVAANYDVTVVKAMEHVLYWVFNRIYDGIAVDEPGLGRVIEASRRGPIVFCPSHKSHVDYLVLSYVLWTHGVAPPHVAAGQNLSFFPLGSLFRRCGAFFIRRSFRGSPLYAAVMRAYLAHLVREGASIEFFLEGTRSRTGKLLQPKFGLLSMLGAAWRNKARDDMVFVPVSIDYERIIEAHAYSRELHGADKKAEDIGGLLRSTKILRSRYGRVQVQFGEPISLADWCEQQGVNRDDRGDDSNAKMRQAIERLGYELLHGVAMVCSVTPISIVATALLGHFGRGMSQGMLIERSLTLINFLSSMSARLSEPLVHEETRVSAVLEAVRKLADEKSVVLERAGEADREPIFRVRHNARLELDYHKNGIMNYFASASLVCRTIVRHPKDEPLQLDTLRECTRWLSQVFKREFIYRVEPNDAVTFDETLGALTLLDIVALDDAGCITVKQHEFVAFLARLLDSFVEGYYVVAQAATELRDQAMSEKEFVVLALERTRRAFLEGDITRAEAASRTLTETALAWLIDEGLIEVAVGRKRLISLPVGTEHSDSLQSFLSRLRHYLSK